MELAEKQLAQQELTACAVNTGRICGELGLTLSDPDPEIRMRAIRRTFELIEFASFLDVPINVGILRGQYRAEVPREQTWELTADALYKVMCIFVIPIVGIPVLRALIFPLCCERYKKPSIKGWA